MLLQITSVGQALVDVHTRCPGHLSMKLLETGRSDMDYEPVTVQPLAVAIDGSSPPTPGFPVTVMV